MCTAALTALLRVRRAAAQPEDHGFARPAGRGRRAKGLTQSQIDYLLSRASGTYNALESGRLANPPADLLLAVARLLNFDEQQWTALWRYARQCDPPHPLHVSSGLEIPAVWQEAVDGITHMAYVVDRAWNMLAHNEAFAAMFPHRDVPRNVMRWMVLTDEARTVLTDWETLWAPVVLPQLRAAFAVHPEDPDLAAMDKEVRDDPLMRPLYESGRASYIHPDGHTRPLRHAELGRGWATMCAASPLTAPRARLMFVLFHPGEQRPPTGPALRAT